MAERLQAQLPREGSPLGETLRLRFQHEVVLARLKRAGDGAAEGDFPPGQVRLARVIDINTGDIQCLRCRKMVDPRLHAVRVTAPFKIEVVGDELVRLGVLAHDLRLPGQILGDLLALITEKGAGEAGVDGIFHRRKILPAVNAVAPVIQTEIVI